MIYGLFLMVRTSAKADAFHVNQIGQSFLLDMFGPVEQAVGGCDDHDNAF